MSLGSISNREISQKIGFCGLAAASKTISGGLGGPVAEFVNRHVDFRDTADKNVKQIMIGGLKPLEGPEPQKCSL